MMRFYLEFIKQRIIGAFTKWLLGPHVTALIVKTQSGYFALDPEDYGVGKKLRKKGQYDITAIEKLAPFIRSDSRVLVVGAHIGTLAIPLSKLCKEIVAIEANPNTYRLLAANVLLNGVSNCRTLNIAASDREENMRFLLSRANSGGSKRVPKKRKFIYDYDHPKEITVKGVRLDQYLNDADFEMVIMDIEGSEYFALQGMRSILSACRVLVVEFVPHHLRNVSGVTVDQFVSAVAPFFSKLIIPSKGISSGPSDFGRCLREMDDLDQCDEGIIFQKV